MHMMDDQPRNSGSFGSQEGGHAFPVTAMRTSSLPGAAGHPGSRFIHQASPMANSEPLNYGGSTNSDPLQGSGQVGDANARPALAGNNGGCCACAQQAWRPYDKRL